MRRVCSLYIILFGNERYRFYFRGSVSHPADPSKYSTTASESQQLVNYICPTFLCPPIWMSRRGGATSEKNCNNQKLSKNNQRFCFCRQFPDAESIRPMRSHPHNLIKVLIVPFCEVEQRNVDFGATPAMRRLTGRVQK